MKRESKILKRDEEWLSFRIAIVENIGCRIKCSFFFLLSSSWVAAVLFLEFLKHLTWACSKWSQSAHWYQQMAFFLQFWFEGVGSFYWGLYGQHLIDVGSNSAVTVCGHRTTQITMRWSRSRWTCRGSSRSSWPISTTAWRTWWLTLCRCLTMPASTTNQSLSSIR